MFNSSLRYTADASRQGRPTTYLTPAGRPTSILVTRQINRGFRVLPTEVRMPRVASHRRRPAGLGLAVIILSAAVWGAGRTVHAQQQGQLFLSVLDANGGPVTDL